MRIWMLMKDGQRLVRKVRKMGEVVPAVGDIYSFNIAGVKDPEMWRVASIHRELFASVNPDGEPFDRLNIEETHEGSDVVVILEWEVNS